MFKRLGPSKAMLSEIVPWDKNPRKNDHAIGPVMESLERYGFVQPLIVRKSDMLLCGGHTRMKAAKLLWGEDFMAEVEYIECDDAEFSRLALQLNRTGEIADWDNEKLAQIMVELRNKDDDLTSLGWGHDEIEAIIGESEFMAEDFVERLNTEELAELPTEPMERVEASPSEGAMVQFPLVLHSADQEDKLIALLKKVKKLTPDLRTNGERVIWALQQTVGF